MIYMLPSNQIAITNITGNGNAAMLAVYLIEKFNLYKKYNKLSHGGFFYLTLKQVRDELGYGREVFDKGIEVLIKLGIIQKDKFYVANAKSKLNHYKIINCEYVSGFRQKTDKEKKADAEKQHHPSKNESKPVSKDCADFGKKCNAENQQQTITENYNSISIVNNINNNIQELIALSNNKLTEMNIKTLLKDANGDYAVIKDKLEIAIAEYQSLDNIDNLVGWLRYAIRDNYGLDVEMPVEIKDSYKKDISKIATTLGIRGRMVTGLEMKSIRSWMQIASLEQIIRAIQITISHIHKPNHNYISRVILSITSGTYRDSNNFYKNYNQRPDDNTDWDKLEAELLARGSCA